ncbi:Dicer-like protein 2 [Ascochyta clinopodiicola]|nr:Dicer-like protein 2 [Ascochyta clinopodiicola]
MELENGASTRAAEVDAQPFVLRSYQAEMVEESLKSNIIVVMDTGSGKTHIYLDYDLMQDPYTKDLLQKQRNGVDVSRQVQKLFVSQKTYCTEQLKILTNKSRDMMQELGPSAVDWYLHQCVARFEKTVGDAEQLLDGTNEEKVHLLHILRKLPFSESPTSSFSVDHISRKVEVLIDTLISEAQDNPSFTGLVFVEQRVWVAVLAELLSVHPRTKDLFRVGTFLGTSQSGKRRAMIATFAEPKNQQSTLEDFRAGKINLILATSVLEEGIDVSSCHLVMCFERPKNLKSFVQRRGRARMQKSRYFVFMPDVGGGRPPESWEALEQAMKRAYLDDLRQSKLEDANELEEEEGSRFFEVHTTGARLTLDDALPHLNHFCTLLGNGPYVDPRPQFRFIRSEVDNVVNAEVTLPISVDFAVRTAKSLESWRTEKMARKDAAFEAYKALYLAGLVNDNMLPVRQETDDMVAEFQVPDHTPSMVPTSQTFNPWPSAAQVQQLKPQTYYRTLVELQAADVKADDLPLVITALTASSTDEDDNYQRLEFLGDCILKFVSSLHVMAENLTWPEHYLTGKKGKIVSNGFLARATLAAGLDRFVITKRFTGTKWAPQYAADALAATTLQVKQDRSSKVVADVVESLIGVAYVVGGFPKAFVCVQTLLPLERWTPIPAANDILRRAAPTNLALTNLDVLEPMIGYTFTKKMLLLEALTHASYTGPNVHCSYERLEFLGDAVLDYLISARLYAHDPPLPHYRMHAIRTAMANAAFLTFSMFETTISEETINKTTLQPEVHQRALWQFLRSGSQQLVATRNVALQQHTEVRVQLRHALEQDDEFPWHLLALTNAPKFLSDIVESVIGAIYIDSHGDFSACEVFVRRLGILDSLERILRDNVDCLHPKERLGHLAVERSVQYVRVQGDAQHSIGLPPGMSKVYRCQVKVGGEDVGGVVEGLTRLNAEIVAAWSANKILRGKEEAVKGGSEEEDVFFDAGEGGDRMLEDW